MPELLRRENYVLDTWHNSGASPYARFTDEEYASLAGKVLPQLKDRCILVIAGDPKDSLETLHGMGIEHFVNKRSNVLEALQHFQQLLGINS